jgi:hypothetical protein
MYVVADSLRRRRKECQSAQHNERMRRARLKKKVKDEAGWMRCRWHCCEDYICYIRRGIEFERQPLCANRLVSKQLGIVSPVKHFDEKGVLHRLQKTTHVAFVLAGAGARMRRTASDHVPSIPRGGLSQGTPQVER